MHTFLYFYLIVSGKSKEQSKSDGSQKQLSKGKDETSHRLHLPTIRGGLNGSIADILEASGYGTETDFKVDEDIK